MDSTTERIAQESFDVIIVGAGISGINAAYRIQTELPGYTYTILEGRGSIGGTWNLFRYPGIRSDSDLHTFGFSWSPWKEKRAIGDGPSIARYMEENAVAQGIDRHIRFHHRLASANWSTKTQAWNLSVETPPTERIMQIQSKFLILATGYYDYSEPLKVQIPGLQENFRGRIIHPQFWPDQLDYTKKNVVIIGSGATAITLLPNLTEKAAHVTMLQRSPTYIMSLPNATGTSWVHKRLPESFSFQLTRLWFLFSQVFIYGYCRLFPDAARKWLQGQVASQLPASVALNPHFTPKYRPWDQRLCFSPDGDFFQALHSGKADVATGVIKEVREHIILLESGQEIDADIIVTATGLRIGIGAGISLSVDGNQMDISKRFAWRSAMLQDMPNMVFMLGYTNAPWTLGADANAWLVVRLLRHMSGNGLASAIPRLVPAQLKKRPLWNLKASYVKEGLDRMPMCGDRGPWKGRTNYFWDIWRAKYATLTEGLEFHRRL